MSAKCERKLLQPWILEAFIDGDNNAATNPVLNVYFCNGFKSINVCQFKVRESRKGSRQGVAGSNVLKCAAQMRQKSESRGKKSEIECGALQTCANLVELEK